MDAEEDGDAVVAVGHVGGHALLQEETESGLTHAARLSLRSFFGFHDFKFGFM